MPTYDFACPAGHEFERFFRKISDAPAELPCVVCGQPAVRRVSGGAGLIFKGSGFYITDYGKDGKKAQQREKVGEGKGAEGTGAETKGGSEGKSGGASPAGATGESKPAGKSADSKPAEGGTTKEPSSKSKDSRSKE